MDFTDTKKRCQNVSKSGFGERKCWIIALLLGSAHHLYFDSQDKVTKTTTELEKICNDSLSNTQSHLFLELHITKLYS